MHPATEESCDRDGHRSYLCAGRSDRRIDYDRAFFSVDRTQGCPAIGPGAGWKMISSQDNKIRRYISGLMFYLKAPRV